MVQIFAIQKFEFEKKSGFGFIVVESLSMIKETLRHSASKNQLRIIFLPVFVYSSLSGVGVERIQELLVTFETEVVKSQRRQDVNSWVMILSAEFLSNDVWTDLSRFQLVNTNRLSINDFGLDRLFKQNAERFHLEVSQLRRNVAKYFLLDCWGGAL